MVAEPRPAQGVAAATIGADGASRTRTVRARGWAERALSRVEALEAWLVVPCAVVLLLYPNVLVVPAALLGALPSLLRLIARGRPWPSTPFDVPIALLLVGGLLGALAGLSADGVALRLYGLLASTLLFAATVRHLTTPTGHRWATLASLGVVFVGTLMLLAIVAPFLRLERAPAVAHLVAGLEWLGVGQGLGDEDALLRRFRLRASGVGALADVGLALAFAVGVGTRSRVRRLAIAPLAAFFGLVVLASDNRGAMLAAVLTIAALVAFVRPYLILLFPLAAGAVLWLLDARVLQKGLELRTVSQRLTMWENGAYLARELPLTGAGLGTESVQLAYQAYFQPVQPNFSHAHNIYLQGLLEQGLFGLLGLVGLTIAALIAGWRLHRRGADRWTLAGGTAGLGGALALFTTGMSEITAVSTIGGAILLAALGLLAAAAPTAERTRRRPRALVAKSNVPIRPVFGGLVGTAVLVGVLVISGLGQGLVAGLLLNAGALQLNRAVVSEETSNLERTKYLERATTLLRLAEELDGGDARIPRNLAIGLDASEDPRRGRAAADRARNLTARTDRLGQLQIGRAYASLGVWGEAIRAWEAAGAGPQLVQLGSRLIRSRNWEQATAAFRSAALVQPQSRGAYEGIGRVARARGEDVEGAIAELRELAARGGDHGYYAGLEVARVLRAEGRAAEALGALDTAHLYGHDPLVDGERAATLIELGRFGEAEDLLTGAVGERPDEWEFYAWLAMAQAGQGEHVEAIATASDGLRLLEANRRAQRGALLAIIGDSYLALGRPSDALATFEDGLRVAPADQRLRDGAERARGG